MMFPNTNQALMRKLTLRSMQANRMRNRYVLLAIVMTTLLLTGVFSVGMSYIASFEREQQRMSGSMADTLLTRPTEQQLAQLRQHPEVDAVGTDTRVASLVLPDDAMHDWRANLHVYDEAEWRHMRAPLYGKTAPSYPQQPDEVIAPTWVLDKLGIAEPQQGMVIPLKIAVVDEQGQRVETTRSLRLIGWYTDYAQLRTGEAGALLVSADWLPARLAERTAPVRTASLQWDYAVMSAEEQQQWKQQLGMSDDQRLIPLRGQSPDNNTATWIGMAGLVLFVMFSGYLLIYNVLYIAVSNDTRFYGLLKTIGMTRRQVRAMGYGQARRLALVGIPVGLAAGVLLSLVAVPLALRTFALETGIVRSFHPWIYIGAAVFTWLTTMAGYRKPMRIASRISPIEASRYVQVSAANRRKKRNTRRSFPQKRRPRRARLLRMALRNVFRDKTRASIVFLSLFLGLTTFLTVNTLVLSMSTDHYIARYVPDDFTVENKTSGPGYQRSAQQAITADRVQALRAMPGVTQIRQTMLATIAVEYDPALFGPYVDAFVKRYNAERPSDEHLMQEGKFWSRLVGLDRADLEAWNAQQPNPIDLERFERGEIALLGDSSKTAPLGSTFRLRLEEGSELHSFEIGGLVGQQYQVSFGGMAPNVYVSHRVMQQLLDTPIVYKMNIMADEAKWPMIRDYLEAWAREDAAIDVSSKLQWAEQLRETKTVLYVLGGAVTVLLALIGLLNVVSTMMTGILVRRQELAMLESVGMTKSQLRRMLLMEGAAYGVSAVTLVGTVGTWISYAAFQLFRQEADYAVYSFPAVPFLILAILVIGVCVAVPLFAFREAKQRSIVERLRDAS